MITELSTHNHQFPFTTNTIIGVMNSFNIKSLYFDTEIININLSLTLKLDVNAPYDLPIILGHICPIYHPYKNRADNPIVG